MTLYSIPQPPPPPSYAEMADAILTFAAEWWNTADQGTPGDLTLLSLAERLAASRQECPTTPNAGLQGAGVV